MSVVFFSLNLEELYESSSLTCVGVGVYANRACSMVKMATLGVPGGISSLTDCTSALPGVTLKRDIKAAPMGAWKR